MKNSTILDSNTNPLDNLDYFLEWGGESWKRLLVIAVKEFLGTDLEGRQILEIGSRYGKISCLFALLGGTVTGIDINSDYVSVANQEAVKLGVQEKTRFICYDGNLDVLNNGKFDIVFTKSVLVVIPKLDEFLTKIAKKLTPEGKVIFIENAYGNRIIQLLRYFRHSKLSLEHFSFFSNKELTLIKSKYDIKLFRQSRIPPVYLICGNLKTKQ